MAMPPVVVRPAAETDLPSIVGVLADDDVGGHGDIWSESTAPAYLDAFREIEGDRNSEILVAEQEGAVRGVLILRFQRGLTDRGGFKAILQSVFVSAHARGAGIGRLMVAEAERRAHARGASRVELVSNKKRLDAHRFYRTLGYAQSHEGFRKKLASD
ncbi:MAG TPA: GNAT family N-acetyltransferase [Rhabdaerophilum sp.]|nr:GNAT family N-acetyltransferase [Rhabdaerophilum sp.]